MDVAESATYAEIHDEPQLPRSYVTSATKSTQIQDLCSRYHRENEK